MDKTVLHDISYGMYVVTTKYNGADVGCTANTFVQITSEDMVVALSLNKENFTNEAVKASKRFALSIISEKSNPEVISKFGFFSSRDTNKFEGFSFIEVDGIKVVNENTCGYIMCEVFNIVDAGTHDIFLAKIKDAERFSSATPMTYSYYHKVVKGKAPKTAPTYVEEQVDNKTSAKKYRCKICGYIYDDGKEPVKFEDLPDTWKCPLCGVPKSMFEEV